MKIIGYARVSSKEQAENSNALNQQVLRLKAAGATDIIQEVETGSNASRPQFRKLLYKVEQNEIQEVVVTRMDRLTRSLKTTIEIREIFMNSLCNLRALDDQIDLSSPTGKFHFSLLGSLAEMEVDRLSERITYGQSAKRKKGEVSKAPFGYSINGQGRLIFDFTKCLCSIESKQEYRIIDLALETIDLFFEHQSLSKTVDRFNSKFGIKKYSKGKRQGNWFKLGWTLSGLRNWLNSPVLLGNTYYPRNRSKKQQEPEIIYNTHEPILSLEDKKRIDSIIQQNKRFKGFTKQSKTVKPTSGLLRCSACNSLMYHYTSKSNGRDGSLRYSYNLAQCYSAKQGLCDRKKVINTDLAQVAIIEHITRKAVKLSNSVVAEESKPQLRSLEIITLEKQLAGLQELGSLGSNPAIEQSIRDVKNQIQSLILNSTSKTDSIAELEDILKQVFSFPEFWQKQKPEDLATIFKKLVNKVTIDNGKVVSVALYI